MKNEIHVVTLLASEALYNLTHNYHILAIKQRQVLV